MKKLKWILLGLVAVVVIGAVIVLAYLDGIVRTVVESQASKSTGVTTTLGGAKISLLGGTVALSDLELNSPKGFEAPKIFTLGGIKVGVSVGHLTETPLKVDEIVITKPVLVIEQSGGKLNFNALMDGMPKSDTPAAPQPGDTKPSEPMKLIIKTLTLNDCVVKIRPGIPGMAAGEIPVPIPSMTLKDIGTGEGNQNGAAIKDVIALSINGLVKQAANSDKLPEPVRMLLSGNIGDVGKKIGDEAKKQLDKGVGDLLGGNKKDGKDSNPLGGLLGGDKKK